MAKHSGFLGRGWNFPPTFSKGGANVLMVEAEEDIVQSIQIILGTRPMERIMQEEFGCDIKEYQFEVMNQRVVTGMQLAIKDALLYYEPRIEVEDVDIDNSDLVNGFLSIHIQYLINSTNTRYNLVYPYYINEATDI